MYNQTANNNFSVHSSKDFYIKDPKTTMHSSCCCLCENTNPTAQLAGGSLLLSLISTGLSVLHHSQHKF